MKHRRDFLKSAAGAAGLLFCGCEFAPGGTALAQTNSGQDVHRGPVLINGKKMLTVDIHCHSYVHDVWPLIEGSEGAEALSGIVNSPLRNKLSSVELRLAEMDREGIDIQAISLHVGQYHHWAERDLASQIVTIQNDKIAEVCADHPDRFVGLGAVALQYPDLAIEQMVHGVNKLDFRGFMITTSLDGEEISAPRFEKFWAKAEELGTVIFIHPRGFPSAGKRFAGHGRLGNIIGNPLDTTVALSHMIFGGLLDRYPGLKICASHGGGYLPSYIGRSDKCYSWDERCQHMEKTPSEYLKQLYFDTLVYSPSNLEHLIDEVGADRVIIGTDYPFGMASKEPINDVLSVPGLSDDDKAAILGATAAGLLKIG